MKKTGFTLIELIGVIALLGIIFLLTYTEVNKSIDKSNNELYQTQLSNIKAAAQDWTVDNIDKLPTEDGKFIYVSLSDLVNGKYIASSITNPKTKENFSNSAINVKITKKSENYIYEVEINE